MQLDRKFANFLLRIVLGIIFTYAGLMKFLGFLKISSYPPIPIGKIITFIPPETSTFILGIVEFIIGILLILGLFTRIASLAAAVLLLIFAVSGLVLDLTGALPGLFMQAALTKDIAMAAASFLLASEGCRKWGLDSRSLERAG